MIDPFATHAPGLTAPAMQAENIVPSDQKPLQNATRAVYVGQGGDMAVRMLSGDLVTLTNLQAGMYYPIRITQVLASGTTANALVGLS